MMPRRIPPGPLVLVSTAYAEWRENKASRLAAALAYHVAFSVGPLLLVSIAVASLVFGDEAARGEVFAQLRSLLGDEGASVVEAAVRGSSQRGGAAISTAIGVAMLAWSASNVFVQLQDALNTIWEVEPDPRAGIEVRIKRRLLTMTMVLGTGFLLLVSLIISAVLALLGDAVVGLLPGGELVWQAVNAVVGLGIVALLFAAIYKVVPDVEIGWSDVWIGAVATALLFTVGKLLIGLYLGHVSVGSTYGAAGSLLVFLVWVYYSAQILLFGAELTQVYARMYGGRIRPARSRWTRRRGPSRACCTRRSSRGPPSPSAAGPVDRCRLVRARQTADRPDPDESLSR